MRPIRLSQVVFNPDLLHPVGCVFSPLPASEFAHPAEEFLHGAEEHVHEHLPNAFEPLHKTALGKGTFDAVPMGFEGEDGRTERTEYEKELLAPLADGSPHGHDGGNEQTDAQHNESDGVHVHDDVEDGLDCAPRFGGNGSRLLCHGGAHDGSAHGTEAESHSTGDVACHGGDNGPGFGGSRGNVLSEGGLAEPLANEHHF